jgi:hypothetical protein
MSDLNPKPLRPSPRVAPAHTPAYDPLKLLPRDPVEPADPHSQPPKGILP